MKDNFWDTVADAPEKEPSAPAIVPTDSAEVFAPSTPAFERARSSVETVDTGRVYTARLSDFDVSVWDSENDAQDIVDWFNKEYVKQGGSEKSVDFFKDATDIYDFNSMADAKTFLALALGILNGKVEIDENDRLQDWNSGEHPQWMKQYEAKATMWAGIAAAFAFTFILAFVLITGSILAMSLLDEKDGEAWPTGEAQIVYFEEWVETSCGDDGCSDTQYAEAKFELHCIEDRMVDSWVCGGNATANTTMFEHDYHSGFFEHAPVWYMIDQLDGEETHAISYNPADPTEVDLRPGFQMNWEWLIPVLIPFGALLVLARNRHFNVKEGYVSFWGLLKGDLEV